MTLHRPLSNQSLKTPHPRTVGWFGTTAVAMGGINQSLFLIGALLIGQGDIPGQGSLLLSWAATPGWLELILMYPNRVGGIAATCAEAFRPYSPILANLTGVCYWWGWANLWPDSLIGSVCHRAVVSARIIGTTFGFMYCFIFYGG